MTSPASSARPGRQRSVTRSGIVLRRWKTPRGDLIVSLLTPQGKLKAIARGGLRGKHASPLNLFHHVELQVYSRPGDDLAVIQQASLEGRCRAWHCRNATPTRTCWPNWPSCCFKKAKPTSTARRLLTCSRGPARCGRTCRPRVGHAGHQLQIAGPGRISPRTRVCVRCGAPDPQHPDPFGGELLCGRCSHQRALSPSTLDFLRNVVRRSVRQNMDSPVPPGERRALWQGLERFVGVQVGKVRSWPQLYTQP
ncbi:DNA repair protein RecO [Deinococcus radiophilus]|uniref:DNA repair protein RecO n=1 Tax=Deinococcus radiophilus TaxID=32062 RepID=UPI0036061358